MMYLSPKKKDYQPRLLYPTKLSFITEELKKSFHDKQKLKEFMTTELELQKISKGILQPEEEDKCNHKNTRKRGGGVTQIVACLPSKHKPLSSNPSHTHTHTHTHTNTGKNKSH
jgi:hypothetical protein